MDTATIMTMTIQMMRTTKMTSNRETFSQAVKSRVWRFKIRGGMIQEVL
jgi:hypothetical protein